MTDNRTDGRRHDLDALRVFCFGTLIIYHTSLAYGTRIWLVNSSDGSKLMDLITLGSHPWRMSLLFFISGLVTASLLKKRSMAEIRRARTKQLLLPFLLGVLFLVPPQVYVSPHNRMPDLSYWEFWQTYLLSGLRLEHMWFLAYLWIYIFCWSIIQPRLLERWPGLSASLAARLQGKGLFLAPIALLSFLRVCLYPIFGETLVISTDLYAHAVYFSMFMAGSLLVNEQNFWQEVGRLRWVSLGLAALSLVALAALFLLVPRETMPSAVVAVARIVRSAFQWCAVLALLAFAARFASRPNRVVAHLNKSIMTYYIAHQTVIVLVAYHISRAGLLDIRSFIPVVIITALICALIAETKTLTTARLIPFLLRTAPMSMKMHLRGRWATSPKSSSV
jgi:glucans biosynthesis protein C